MFWLEQRRVPGPLAITGVMIGIFGILFTVGALLVQSGTAFTDRLPFYQARVTELVSGTVAWLANLGVEIKQDGGHWSWYRLRAVDDAYLETVGYDLAVIAEGYASDQEVWEAIRDQAAAF